MDRQGIRSILYILSRVLCSAVFFHAARKIRPPDGANVREPVTAIDIAGGAGASRDAILS